MKAPAVPPIAELELGPFIVMTGSSKPSILENDCKAKVPAPAENLIFFVFRPDKPLSGCNACRNLVHVQFVRTLADSGSGPVPIKESEFQGVAGMQFDAVTEDKELWHVDQDHVAPSLQPFLQGVDQSSENGCAGFKSFIASHSSWSFDQPSTAGGSKAFSTHRPRPVCGGRLCSSLRRSPGVSGAAIVEPSTKAFPGGIPRHSRTI
jgi:hypothetical protein